MLQKTPKTKQEKIQTQKNMHDYSISSQSWHTDENRATAVCEVAPASASPGLTSCWAAKIHCGSKKTQRGREDAIKFTFKLLGKPRQTYSRTFSVLNYVLMWKGLENVKLLTPIWSSLTRWQSTNLLGRVMWNRMYWFYYHQRLPTQFASQCWCFINLKRALNVLEEDENSHTCYWRAKWRL